MKKIPPLAEGGTDGRGQPGWCWFPVGGPGAVNWCLVGETLLSAWSTCDWSHLELRAKLQGG